MKIENVAAQNAQAAYRNATDPTRAVSPAQAAGTQAPAKAQRGDLASISPQGRRQAEALSAVMAAPEIRTNLVSQAQTEIQNGTYKVDEDNIANQLLKPSGIG
jgi:flagellar biosynthesis anti-sigma factor FlgM